MTEGGCFCGSVRYRVTGEPRVVTHCHCLHCRRTSGAAFVTWAEFPADRFVFVKGNPARFQSRPEVTRSFCSSCGSPLTYQTTESPDWIDVTVCTLDDPAAAAPQDHVFHSRRLPWVQLADGLPVHATSREAER